MFIKISPYLIALLIGLLVGVDRERQGMASHQAMGVRSYILLAMAGALTGGINQPMFTLGMFIFASAITLYGYVKSSSMTQPLGDSIGLTSEITAMVTFALSYFAHHEPFISLALGALTLVILHHKLLIHRLVKAHIRPNEIQGFAVLLLLAIGVVPLIPNQAIDPLHIFYPRRLAMIIVVLAGIQFGGYLTIRFFGNRIGLLLAGFFAGLASSTAVFVSYPNLAKNKPGYVAPVAGAAILSITATLMLVIVVVGVVSWRLIIAIIIPLSSLIIVTAIIGILLSLKKGVVREKSSQSNPLNLWSAIKLGLFLTVLMFLVDLTERFLGRAASSIISFLSGLFELHGVIIANANMLENETIALNAAVSSTFIAITASMFSKIFITGFMGRGAYRWLMLPIVTGLFAMSGGLWLLIRLVPAIVIKV